MPVKSSIYGKGLAFPFRLDATGARPALSSEEELVQQSIYSILMTNIGERPFLVKNGIPYGTRLRSITFEDSSIAREILQHDIKLALDTWEPRIVVSAVVVSREEEALNRAVIWSRVLYRYRSTNRPDNYVVPYRVSRPL